MTVGFNSKPSVTSRPFLVRPPSSSPLLPPPVQVKALADEEGYSTWTTGIAEVQLSIE